MPEPFFALRKLMYEKYGEDRFALACEIVARWIYFETKNKSFDAVWVNSMCNAHANTEFELSAEVGEVLRKLFNLKSTEELFTKTTV